MSKRLEIKIPGRKYTNNQGQEKQAWNRVGTAFVNDDGSVSLEIDPGISVAGKMKCFEPLPPRDGQQRPQQGGGGGGGYSGEPEIPFARAEDWRS